MTIKNNVKKNTPGNEKSHTQNKKKHTQGNVEKDYKFTMLNEQKLWPSFKTGFNLKICMDSKIRRSIALDVEPIMQKSSKVTGTPHDSE